MEGGSRKVVEKAYTVENSHRVVLLLEILDHFEWDREVLLRAI